MKKNDSFPKNYSNQKLKNLDQHIIRKININNDKKNNNKDIKYKNIKDKNLLKNSNFKKRKSSLITLSRSNCFKNDSNNKIKKKINNKFMTELDNIKIYSYINNPSSKNKNRYLTCFESNNMSTKNENNKDNKISNLLNDFIIPNDLKNKENINIKSNGKEDEQDQENSSKFIIKVNKKKPNINTKKFYIQACLNLKKKQINKNEKNIKLEKERERSNFLKLKKKNSNRKRNILNFSQTKNYKHNFSSLDDDNNNNKRINRINRISKNVNSLSRMKNSSNSFWLNEKKLFLNNNYIKKNRKKDDIININDLIFDKSKNKSCFDKEEKGKINAKLTNSINSINTYNQKKITVQKHKSPKPLNLEIKTKNSNFSSLKSTIENNIRIKSEKNDIIISSVNNDLSDNNIKNNFDDKFVSLDFSLNNKLDFKSIEATDNHKGLLSERNAQRFDKKNISIINKERFRKKLSKNNTHILNFDFDELNQKLFKMIKRIESHEKEPRGINTSRKKEEGFIKWDLFEKMISQEN